MAHLSRHNATYDDFLRVPAHLIGEILDGDLHTYPRPMRRDAFTGTALINELNGPFQSGDEGPETWRILEQPELHLGSQVLIADLAGWRRARLPELPATTWLSVTPDWVCEILAPTTARIDRVIKLRIYAEHGVAHAWLIDPALQTLEVYRLVNGHWLLLGVYAGQALVNAPPFATIDLDLDELWP